MPIHRRYSFALSCCLVFLDLSNMAHSLRISRWRAQHERRAKILQHNDLLHDTCKIIVRSREAKLFENRVDWTKRHEALLDKSIAEELYIESGELPPAIVQHNWPSSADPKWCDADEFVPFIEDLGEIAIGCSTICSSCWPGSIAYCRMKNPKYRRVAQWCLCSYDEQKPLEAAFAIRHSRGVIMPKLRRRLDEPDFGFNGRHLQID